MFGYAALEIHWCLQEPPERRAAFYLLLLSSIIPVLDTVSLAISNAADSLKEFSPTLAPCIDGCAWAVGGVADAVGSVGAAIVRPATELVEGIVQDVVRGRSFHVPSAVGWITQLLAPLEGYGAVVRATPFKSFVAVITFAITVERYSGAMSDHGGAYGNSHSGGVGDTQHHGVPHGRRMSTDHLIDATFELLEEFTFFVFGNLSDFLSFLGRSHAMDALVAEGSDLLGTFATAAATSSAVTKQIKPKEFEAAQAVEQRRIEEMQSRRDAEIAANASLDPTEPRPVPWSRIVQLGAVVMASLSLGFVGNYAPELLPHTVVSQVLCALVVWVILRCMASAKPPQTWVHTQLRRLDSIPNKEFVKTVTRRGSVSARDGTELATAAATTVPVAAASRNVLNKKPKKMSVSGRRGSVR